MRDGPLDGVKVLDLSIALTGPYAVALLADQGADVVKVERPGIGDIGRWVGVSVGGMSALFLVCNRGKRSIAVDVQTETGRDIVRRLARDVDVVVQNFRPGVIDRLGLGYDDLRAGHPDLVYVSISGFGTRGPVRGQERLRHGHPGVRRARRRARATPTTGEPVFLRQTAADKVTALVRGAGDHGRAVRARAREGRAARRAVDARRGRLVPLGRRRGERGARSTPTARSLRASCRRSAR